MVLKAVDWDVKPQGEGSGYSHFSSYVGSGPASTVHPQRFHEFQAPQKTFEILATPKMPPFRTLTLRNDPKMHSNDP